MKWITLALLFFITGCRTTIAPGGTADLATHGDQFAWLSEPVSRGSVDFSFKSINSDRSLFRLRLRDPKGAFTEVLVFPDRKGESAMATLPPGYELTGKAVRPSEPLTLRFDVRKEPFTVQLSTDGQPWPLFPVKGASTYEVVAVGVHDASATAVLDGK